MESDPRQTSAPGFETLSRVLLAGPESTGEAQRLGEVISAWSLRGWAELASMAAMNHVIMRAYPRLQALLPEGRGTEGLQFLEQALKKESARIQYAIPFLHRICQALEGAGNVIVIKSLDHWPDLGSDLDLYTDPDPRAIVEIMQARFHAEVEKQSWGDRLANKWNFAIPALPELLEVHIGRLGQTGEQRAIGESLVKRSVFREINGYNFRVSATEDRIVISTLQRMFRHFYVRLCDVIELAQLMDAGAVNYEYLHSLAEAAGLWEGVATYLRIVSEYAAHYRGTATPLPAPVRDAALFGNDQVYFRKGFLRIPIMPHSARLYVAELGALLSGGEIGNSLRLSLLPALATAAAIKQGITNSDKGVW
jgi:hypothetical protein